MQLYAKVIRKFYFATLNYLHFTALQTRKQLMYSEVLKNM